MNIIPDKKNSSGFTLVETLVAITIFSIGLLALMNVLGSGIANTEYAKRKITAGYLAQEGIEYIRNLRDTYVLYSSSSAAGWLAFKTQLALGSCKLANGCYFDDRNVVYTNNSMPMTSLIFAGCSTADCSAAPLLYEPTSGRYNYVSGTNSGYVRKIQSINQSANETKIISTVYWTQGSGTYSVSLSENLFNWVE